VFNFVELRCTRSMRAQAMVLPKQYFGLGFAFFLEFFPLRPTLGCATGRGRLGGTRHLLLCSLSLS
jgi:hypothetical protein